MREGEHSRLMANPKQIRQKRPKAGFFWSQKSNFEFWKSGEPEEGFPIAYCKGENWVSCLLERSLRSLLHLSAFSKKTLAG